MFNDAKQPVIVSISSFRVSGDVKGEKIHGNLLNPSRYPQQLQGTKRSMNHFLTTHEADWGEGGGVAFA
jgi:hypothetical protein